MNPVRRLGALASLFLFALLPALLSPVAAGAYVAADRIASKSISRVYAVQQNVFVLAEDGFSFSWLNLFKPTAEVRTVEWPWEGPAEDGVPWRQAMLLRANYSINDSQRVARLASAPAVAILSESPTALRGDSLIFKDTNLVTARGAALTGLAVRGDTALLGFGRLGLAYTRINGANEISGPLVLEDSVSFRGFAGTDSVTRPLIACRWNRLCRADTITMPVEGLDSVISVALDTTSGGPWILVATQNGLRRGTWRGTSFPFVTLPGIPDSARVPVRSVFTSPTAARAWAFTGSKFFYSDDHGASFRVPLNSNLTLIPSSQLTNYSTARPPTVAFAGDTTYINFNMDSVGIVRFRHDTLQVNSAGGGFDQVLLNANDSLDVGNEESLTGIAVARNGTTSVLVTGTTRQGIFYRRLDLPGKTFTNLTSRAALKSNLGEVITYPTLFEGPGSASSPEYVRIGYRLKKTGKVTITIFNYAMEKVKVVVRNAPRQGGVPRSESFSEDRWDGRDSAGRLVSVGTYYVRVESDQGEAAFGKILYVRGRR